MQCVTSVPWMGTTENCTCIFSMYLGTKLKCAINKFLSKPKLISWVPLTRTLTRAHSQGLSIFLIWYVFWRILSNLSIHLIVTCKLNFDVAEIYHLEIFLEFRSCFIQGWWLWIPSCSSRLTIKLICLLWMQPTCIGEKALLTSSVVQHSVCYSQPVVLLQAT